MSGSRILLIGKRGEETESIRSRLETGTGYSISVATQSHRVIEKVTRSEVDLCVFNFDLVTVEKMQIAKDLKNLGFNIPVLVLSQIVAGSAYVAIQNMDKTILLEKPIEEKDLLGVSQKLISGRTIQQQRNRRFATRQGAQVQFAHGNTVLGWVFNLSKGGAYVELPPSVVIKGDRLRLHVMLNQIERKYSMNARVVWINPIAAPHENIGFGVEFYK